MRAIYIYGLIIPQLILLTCLGNTNELEKAYGYHERGAVALGERCKVWSKKEVSDGAPSSPVIRDAYEIFEDIWNPTNLVRLSIDSGSKYEKKYENASYLCVQGTLKVRMVTDSKNFEKFPIIANEQADRLSDVYLLNHFAPFRNEKPGNLIVLDAEIKDELQRFLGPYVGYILPPESIDEKAQKRALSRYEFISKFLPIETGHWDGWELVSYPQIPEIIFSQDQMQAIAVYWIGDRGGVARYSKIDEKWTFISAHLAWCQ